MPQWGRIEEASLCYSSSLLATLDHAYHPLPNSGSASCTAIISPKVVIYRDSIHNGLAPLAVNDRKVVAIITATSLWFPALTRSDEVPFHLRTFRDGYDRTWFREKFRFILRLAASQGQTYVILGAFGHQNGCPPAAIATAMKSVPEEREFDGCFRKFVFVINCSARLLGTWNARAGSTTSRELVHLSPRDAYCVFRDVFAPEGTD